MNEVEKMATEMSEKKKRPLRCIARDHEWLMPCYRFSDNGFKRQIGKICEEVAEADEAYERFCAFGDHESRLNLLVECADIQHTVETLMHLLGTTAKERTMARRLVWEKNNNRGYYKKKRKE